MSVDAVTAPTRPRSRKTKMYCPPKPHAKQARCPLNSWLHQPYPYSRSESQRDRVLGLHDASTHADGMTCCPPARPPFRYNSPNVIICRGVISMSLPPK